MPKPECDLVISGGRVIDLSIASGVLDGMAIAVRDGVIVAMATAREIEASFTAGRVIDATGQVVTPGFVDAHGVGLALAHDAAERDVRSRQSVSRGSGRVRSLRDAVVHRDKPGLVAGSGEAVGCR